MMRLYVPDREQNLFPQVNKKVAGNPRNNIFNIDLRKL